MNTADAYCSMYAFHVPWVGTRDCLMTDCGVPYDIRLAELFLVGSVQFIRAGCMDDLVRVVPDVQENCKQNVNKGFSFLLRKHPLANTRKSPTPASPTISTVISSRKPQSKSPKPPLDAFKHVSEQQGRVPAARA